MSLIPQHLLKLMSPQDRKALGKSGVLNEEAILAFEIKNEKALQWQIVSLLRIRGIHPMWVAFGKPTRITEGWPDITFCYKGIPVCWEVKYGKGTLNGDQESVHKALLHDGWIVEIIRSVSEAKQTLDDIQNKLLK